MSWIIGFFGRDLPGTIVRAIGSLHPEPSFRWSDERFHLAAGGIPETCFGGRSAGPGETREWAVVGIGIVPDREECRILPAIEWERMLLEPSPDLRSIDGHFLAVRRRGESVELLKDQLGLITI
jgi:hypothetical protein